MTKPNTRRREAVEALLSLEALLPPSIYSVRLEEHPDTWKIVLTGTPTSGTDRLTARLSMRETGGREGPEGGQSSVVWEGHWSRTAVRLVLWSKTITRVSGRQVPDGWSVLTLE